jgi:hypothetical protein
MALADVTIPRCAREESIFKGSERVIDGGVIAARRNGPVKLG